MLNKFYYEEQESLDTVVQSCTRQSIMVMDKHCNGTEDGEDHITWPASDSSNIRIVWNAHQYRYTL
jgi:hypothetical protein